MKQNFIGFLFILSFTLQGLAQQTGIKGSVLDGLTSEPIPDVTVTIEETGQTTKTDANGRFSFNKNITLGEQILKVEKIGYIEKRYPIVVNQGAILTINDMTLDYNQSDKDDLFIISISDENLNTEYDGIVDNVSGLLQASRDIFLSAAAFDFSAAFFKPRGLDNANGKVLINGVEMNKQFNGRPQWANWGGLNDVQRNQEFSMGISANDYTFGDLAGTNNIIMRASKYPKGGRVSFASANRSYQGRIMASYSSGLLKGGWAYAILGSRRFGKQGFIDGTLYDANSLFVSVEKQINDKHNINFTGIYAKNRRGRSTAITEEVFWLKGKRYNPFWGLQSGEQRNARIRNIDEPVMMLNYFWKISNKVRLNTNISYQLGEIANTRIDNNGARFDPISVGYYGGARNPTPEYYQNLPSYHLRFSNLTAYNFQQAFLSQKEFVADGQLDWNNFYSANLLNGYNIYALKSDVIKDKQRTFNSILDAELSDKIRLNANINYRGLKSENFARIEDLLNGSGYLDVDSFTEDGQGANQGLLNARQSNLLTPNRIASKGDKYGYHYTINSDVLLTFIQAQFKLNKLDFYLGVNVSNTTYQRNGFYENGFYPNNIQGRIGSFGKSKKLDFTNIGVKGGFDFNIFGRHLVSVNSSYFTKAPTIRSSFANARQNNLVVDGLRSEGVMSIDASYIFRSPTIKTRLTGYYSNFTDGNEVNFFFSEATTTLAQEIMTDVDKQHIGAELGLEVELIPTIKLKGVASLGHFVYANNPNIYYSANLFTQLTFEDAKTKLKDLHLPSGPEQAFQLGFEYRDPNYWNIGITSNFFSHAFVDPNALRRSGYFTQDIDTFDLEQIIENDHDGVVNVSGYGINNYDKDTAKSLLQQEQLGDYMLINAIGGKSWKINDYFIGFFATINNILNQEYRTGGFEQARLPDYRSQMEEQNRPYGPLFGNRYFFGNGTTYYLNVYLRF